MAGEPVTTIVGNLAGDPELSFTASGAAVSNFTVCTTPRSFDKQTNEWVDGETMFTRCSVWREAAENVAESLRKGDRVIVMGKLTARSWEKDGVKRTNIEMMVDEVGPSLWRASAKVTKAQRAGGQGQQVAQQEGWNRPPSQGQQRPGGNTPDPWATQPAGGAQQGAQQGGWSTGPSYDQEPPFAYAYDDSPRIARPRMSTIADRKSF